MRYVYDLAPYPETRRPISVHEIRRQRHRWDLVRDANATRAQQNLPPLTPAEIDAMFGPDELAAHPERFVQTRAFSDGFGRVVQTRTEREPISFGDAGLSPSLSEPAPPATGTSATGIAVVVSGWQLYDDKGRPVVKYEPFFSTGWNFAEPTTADLGALQRSTLAYDPLGRLVRSINPDGSSSRMVHGVPGTLAAPDLASDAFEPTPWERWSYDESDNGGRTPATAGASNQTHWNTPSSVILDALQRPVVSVDRSGMAATDSLRSESRYDITGNLISVSDPLGRTAFAYAHDLLGRRWREQTLDGGVRRVVFDAVGPDRGPGPEGALRFTALDSWVARSSPGRGMRRAPSGGSASASSTATIPRQGTTRPARRRPTSRPARRITTRPASRPSGRVTSRAATRAARRVIDDSALAVAFGRGPAKA